MHTTDGIVVTHVHMYMYIYLLLQQSQNLQKCRGTPRRALAQAHPTYKCITTCIKVAKGRATREVHTHVLTEAYGDFSVAPVDMKR